MDQRKPYRARPEASRRGRLVIAARTTNGGLAFHAAVNINAGIVFPATINPNRLAVA
jgi:hypothetical protein